MKLFRLLEGLGFVMIIRIGFQQLGFIFFSQKFIFTTLKNYLFNDKGLEKLHVFPKCLLVVLNKKFSRKWREEGVDIFYFLFFKNLIVLNITM